MIAVADASPLCYLTLISEIDLLPKLFSRVVAPQTVIDELLHEGAPATVRVWACQVCHPGSVPGTHPSWQVRVLRNSMPASERQSFWLNLSEPISFCSMRRPHGESPLIGGCA